jgi:hypothetical protein
MASTSREIYYLSNICRNGWLKVNVIGLGDRFLCYGTKISKIETYDKFEYVKILDGPFRDFFSKITLNNASHFEKITESYKEEPATLVYDQTRKKIGIAGLGLFNTAISNVILPKGIYLLEIPSHPHKKTPNSYLNEKNGGSKFAETWFRVVPLDDNHSDVFFHFGKLSEGCVTVNELGSWDEIYYHIIRCRKNRLDIGTIEIK